MSDLPSWAVRGARVVCVVDSPSYHPDGWNTIKGEVYTIRRVDTRGRGYVVLREFKNPNTSGPYWPLADFRPAVEPKAETEDEDVALLRRHLDQSHPVDA